MTIVYNFINYIINYFNDLDEMLFGKKGKEIIKDNEQILLIVLSLLILLLLLIKTMTSQVKKGGGFAGNAMSSISDSMIVNQDMISSIILEFAMAIFIAIAFLPSLSLLGIILVCIHVIRPKLAYLYTL